MSFLLSFLMYLFVVLVIASGFAILLFHKSDDIKKEDWTKLVQHDIDIKLSKLRIKGLEQRILFLENYLASKKEQEQIAKQILDSGITKENL